MASNSLLECVVFGRAAAQDILDELGNTGMPADLPCWDESKVTDSDEDVIISHNWDELRRFMWDYVGIVRTTKRLQRRDLLELRNLALVADLIITSAMQRRESRGLHYTLDYPRLLPEASDTILQPPSADD